MFITPELEESVSTINSRDCVMTWRVSSHVISIVRLRRAGAPPPTQSDLCTHFLIGSKTKTVPSSIDTLMQQISRLNVLSALTGY